MEGQPASVGRCVYVLDCHEIHRRGLQSVLAGLAGIDAVAGAASVAAAEAGDRRALERSDVVLIDVTLTDAVAFIARIVGARGRAVLAYVGRYEHALVRAALDAGAIGLLAKDAMTPEILAAALDAAFAGSCVFSPQLLPRMLADPPTPPLTVPPSLASAAPHDAVTERLGTPAHAEPQGHIAPPRHGRLTRREQDVLRLIAQGHATREVARELCYSERTIKNVIHDAVTKLEARSRSHAVACAVRHGLI